MECPVDFNHGIYGKEMIPNIIYALKKGNHSAAYTMMAVVEVGAGDAEVPPCFACFKKEVKRLSIPDFMESARWKISREGDFDPIGALGELREAKSLSEELRLPLPEGYAGLRKEVCREVAIKLRRNAGALLRECKETGVHNHYLDMSIDMAYKFSDEAGVGVPKVVETMRRQSRELRNLQKKVKERAEARVC